MLLKAMVIALWLFAISGPFVEYADQWGTVARWMLAFLVVTHIGETLFFYKRIRDDSEPFVPTLISSLIFGIVHNRRYLRK